MTDEAGSRGLAAPLSEGSSACHHPLPFERALAQGGLCLLAGVFVYVLLGFLAFRHWHPELSELYRELLATTIVDPGLSQPEPQERRFFLLVVFTSPCLFLLAWQTVSTRSVGRLVARHANVLVAVATGLIAMTAGAALMAKNPLPQPQPAPGTGEGTFAVASNVNAGFYLFGTFVYDHPYLYAGVVFPFCLWLLTNRRVRRFLDEQGRVVNRAILVFAGGVAAWMLASSTFRFPYTFENRYDLSAVYYPMVQVYYGAPLLVDRFADTYGLYPQFLLPVFRLVGLSFATFSGTMAVLTVACFSLLLMTLWRLIANRLLLLWSFAAVVFYVYCYSRTVSAFDPYFASIPLRLLAPMAALGLALRCRRGMPRSQAVAALTLLGFGVLWSPDFGLMSYLAFTLYLGYLRIDPKMPRDTIVALVETLILSLATLLGVFVGYALFIRVVYGTLPDFSLLFGSLKVFSGLGMNMLPMPLLHPWNLMALTLAGGLLATLPRLLAGEHDERSALLFLLTLLGIGTFSYYQGRSHNWNLLMVEIFTIPLWGVCADRLLFHLDRNRWLFAPLSILVFVLGTALPQLAYAAPALARLVEERENRVANLVVQQQIESNAEFIRNGTMPGEKVQIITSDYLQGLYHGLAQRGSAFNPGYLDLFWRDDFERFLNFLRMDATTKVYFETNTRLPFEPSSTGSMMTLLQCCYAPVDSNGVMLELGRLEEDQCRDCLERAGWTLPPPGARGVTQP